MKKVPLLVIVFLAAILRLYRLGEVPVSLNADEAAIGYNAFSILKTGRDEYGQRFPLAFRSFDDYKAPLYIYLTAPAVAAFGLTPMSVRLPSAIAGILAVVGTYFLVKELSYNNYIALISAALLAISPWHIQFSRSAYEANLALFLVVAGVVLFLWARRRSWTLMLSAGAFALSLWAYHAPRLFVPLLVVGLIIIYRREVFAHAKASFAAFVVGGVLLVPLGLVLLSPTGLVRARGISSLDNPDILARSVRWMGVDRGNGITMLFHNRRVEYAREIISGYLAHFDPSFLFLEKAQQKYRSPGVGLMYLWELPVLLVGFYCLVRDRRRWSTSVIMLWIALAPLPAAPTLWLPSAVRTLLFLPATPIAVAVGLWEIFRWLGRKPQAKRIVGFAGFIAIIGASVVYYLHQYYVHLPIEYASDWLYGREEVVREVGRREGAYDKVVVSVTLDQPHIFFLYYLRYDPVLYLAQGGTVSGKFDAQSNHFDKYVFKSVDGDQTYKDYKTLYVGAPEEVPSQASVLSRVNYPDGSAAFLLYEI